jgi:hypothetical protein
MLDKLTVDDFKPAVGQRFTLDLDGTGELELELVEAATQDPDGKAAGDDGTRRPFHVHFRGPGEPILPQRIYAVKHDAVGALEIFIVPVGRDAEGTLYEAIFA